MIHFYQLDSLLSRHYTKSFSSPAKSSPAELVLHKKTTKIQKTPLPWDFFFFFFFVQHSRRSHIGNPAIKTTRTNKKEQKTNKQSNTQSKATPKNKQKQQNKAKKKHKKQNKAKQTKKQQQKTPKTKQNKTKTTQNKARQKTKQDENQTLVGNNTFYSRP